MINDLFKEWAYRQDTDVCVKIANNEFYRSRLSPSQSEVISDGHRHAKSGELHDVDVHSQGRAMSQQSENQ